MKEMFFKDFPKFEEMMLFLKKFENDLKKDKIIKRYNYFYKPV